MLTRGHGAITHFARAAKQKVNPDGAKDFPRWGFLASECWETAQAVIVRIELPGMRQQDIDVSFSRGRLRLRGEKRYSHGPDARHYHLMERAFGRFERSIALPAKVDADGAEVSYQQGVVTVIVPKTEVTPPTV